MNVIIPRVCLRSLGLVVLVVGVTASTAWSEDRSPVIVFEPTAGKTGHVEVRHLSEPELATAAQLEPADWPERLRVSVDHKNADELPAIAGRYTVADGVVRFVPRYPLEAGVRYRAVYRFSEKSSRGDAITRVVELPAERPEVPTEVAEVYPTQARLPENLLKFYLHFTAPMSQGNAYDHIHLLDAAGQEVEMPFLEIGEELWNEDGTRLTLLFDPGRIKRGLVPRQEEGPALEEGKEYTLVLDADWLDANGQPLKSGFRRKFVVGPPDDRQPSIKRWSVEAPIAGTTAPLVLGFDEPLDHAMLHRVLVVESGEGKRVPGRIEVDRKATQWRFHPNAVWRAGSHRVVIETTLEDLAGNSLGRPFEVDVFRAIEERVIPETVQLPFTVPPPAGAGR